MIPDICLAPLKGVTDAVFRTTYAEFFPGIDWAVAPFLTTVMGPRVKPSHLKQVLPENNLVLPIVPQIISKTASNFTLLANVLFDLGYRTVNWNLGCPYPMVAKKGRGSGMLPHPEAVTAFLDQALPAMSGCLSIKMRLGRFHTREAEALLPLLDGYPIESIAIHPRTGVQMYAGRPDLDAFASCLALTGHRVIYNGDIDSKGVFDRLQDRFPQIGSWMLGRGVLANPVLPMLIKGRQVTDEEGLDLFSRFHDVLFKRYEAMLFGPSHLLNRMKSLWTFFSDGFKDGHNLRKQIHKSQKVNLYCDIVNRFFDGRPLRRTSCETGEWQ